MMTGTYFLRSSNKPFSIMEEGCPSRKFGFIDPNVAIPARSSGPTSRFVNARRGQENQPKKRKLEHVENSEISKRCILTSTPKRESSKCSKFTNETVFLAEQWALTPDFVKEIVQAELKLECRGLLSKKFCSNPLFEVTPSHRELLVEWLIDLQSYFKVGNEVLHLAVMILDRVLDRKKIVEGKMQGFAAASMWLSFKFHCGGMKAKLILKFCNSVTLQELVQCERTVLMQIGMNLLFTNTITVLHSHLHKVFGQEVPILEYHASNYLLEIMLLHLDFAGEPINIRTAVAVQTALELLESDFSVHVNDEGASRIYRRLLKTLRMVSRSPAYRETSSLYRKYSCSRYGCISTHPCMNIDTR